jgi:hypothetical protein
MAEASPAFPVQLVRHRSRGRELLAAAPVASGSEVLRCLPLALAPADTALATHCAACLSELDAGGAACGGGCGYRRCSSCLGDARWAAVHAAGECVSLRHLWTLLGRGAGGAAAANADVPAAAPPRKRQRAAAAPPPASQQSDSAALRVLLRLAYVRALEQQGGDKLPPHPDTPLGDAVADDADAADTLLSHFDALSDAQRAHALGMADTARWCLVAVARRGREALAHEAAALWCNSFDAVDAESGTSLGEGLWPSLALGLNHRCGAAQHAGGVGKPLTRPTVSVSRAQLRAQHGLCVGAEQRGRDLRARAARRGARRGTSPVAPRRTRITTRRVVDMRAHRTQLPRLSLAAASPQVLTIAYCNLFTAKRRQHLRGTYFFTCRCARCTSGDDARHVPPLAAAAAAALAAVASGSGDWAAAAAAATALEAAVAPLVAAGAAWARLTLARARWLRLRAAAEGGVRDAALPSASALAAELALLLGQAHPFTRRVLRHS